MKEVLLAVLILFIFLLLISCSPIPEDKNTTKEQLKKPTFRSSSNDSADSSRKLARKRGNKLLTKSNEPSVNRNKSKVLKIKTRKEMDGLTTINSVVTASENTTSSMTAQLSPSSSTEASLTPAMLFQTETITTVVTESCPTAIKPAKAEKKKKKEVCCNRDHYRQIHENELFPIYPDAHHPIMVPDYYPEMDQFYHPGSQIVDTLPLLDQVSQWDYGSWSEEQHPTWNDPYWSGNYGDETGCSKSRKCKNAKKNKKIVKDIHTTVEPQKVTTELVKTIPTTKSPPFDEELWNEIMELFEDLRSQMKAEPDFSLKKRLAKLMKEALNDFVKTGASIKENNADAS
ncbi:hypothetical protein Aperf_G00000058593 [Anoplocephala perfoliata]